MASYARLGSRRRDFHRSLRELPNREDNTENKDCVNQNLEDATAFFFRAPLVIRYPFRMAQSGTSSPTTITTRRLSPPSSGGNESGRISIPSSAQLHRTHMQA